MEFRLRDATSRSILHKGDHKVFSFSENTVSLFEVDYARYNVSALREHALINRFLQSVSVYLVDDYDTIVGRYSFEELHANFHALNLYGPSDDYKGAGKRRKKRIAHHACHRN